MDKREKIIENIKNFFKNNSDLFNVGTAFLYGSWASGFPREDSDIGIAVAFDDDLLSEDKCFEVITEIGFKLSMQTGMGVNVIPVYTDFRKPMLYYNAIVSGLAVYVRNSVKYIDLVNEALCQMEDFKMFGISWQIEAAKKKFRRTERWLNTAMQREESRNLSNLFLMK